MFWKSKPTLIETCAHALYEALTKTLTQNGRIHVEDLISAADSIVGILKDKLTSCGFTKVDFPILKDVFTYFAPMLGTKKIGGKFHCLCRKTTIHLFCRFVRLMKCGQT